MEKSSLIRKANKRAQAWGIDLMIASVIFTVAIVFFYFYALNEPAEAEEKLSALYYDGKIISDSILSEGYPQSWNASNVVITGILTNNKINETKLKNFYNLSSTTGYARTKRLFNTRYEYYFNLSETMMIGGIPVNGIGSNPTNQKNLVKITRFTIYQDKPMTAYLYVWE